MSNPYEYMQDHIERYLATNGEDGHIFENGTRCLVLTARGRKSGEPRQAVMIYGRTGDSYCVVASKGGAPQHPAWFHNALASGVVTVQVGSDVFQAGVRQATDDEYPLLWEQMVEIFPPYAEYQEKADRQIPILILTPQSVE